MKPKEFEVIYKFTVASTVPFPSTLNWNTEPIGELVRCKDCRWFSQTTLGMTYACWHGAETVWGQTGEHAGHNCCQRIESEEHYCGYGERKEHENPEKD